MADITTLLISTKKTAEEIAELNRQYEGMNLPVRMIDASAADSIMIRLADGTWSKPRSVRRSKAVKNDPRSNTT